METLTTQYDSRASFYGKAMIINNPDKAKDIEYTKTLLSYQTPVSAIQANGKAVVFDTYSTTTLRHIKEFLKQNGFKAESKAQIIKDYMTN